MNHSYAEKRAGWLRDAIARHTAEMNAQVRPRRRDKTLRIEWLDRGEWVVRRGVVNLAWFREYEAAEKFVKEGAR